MGFENGLKTIVVATDLGGQAEAALEYARKLATHYGARIVLAHGLDPMEYAAVDTVPGSVLASHDGSGAQGAGPTGRRAAARGDSQPFRGAAGRGGGDAGGCGAAIQGRADRDWHQGPWKALGRGGGSHCRTPGEAAPCPVLAVAADWNAGPHRPTPGGPVLLAMERNDAAAAAAATAASLAETCSIGRFWCCMCARPRKRLPV
jgi:hypothetical protein